MTLWFFVERSGREERSSSGRDVQCGFLSVDYRPWGGVSAYASQIQGGVMRAISFLAVAMAFFCAGSQAQLASASANERMFFPSDTFWGYAQFDLAPPHNEIDPNLCAANARNYGGANAPCNAFARYMLSGLVEIRPFGRGPLRRFMLFGEPSFLFGKNVPQSLYTWSFDAIGIEHSWGFVVYVAASSEIHTLHLHDARR